MLPNASSTLPIFGQQITFTGPTAARSYALPDASTTFLTTNAAVTVAQGGTGVATLTANGVLVGAGAGNIVATAVGTAGQCLTSNGAGLDPTFQACGAGGGANTALSNLAAVAINTTLVSDLTNTDDLGTTAIAWRTAYIDTSIISEGATADLDETTVAFVDPTEDVTFNFPALGVPKTVTIDNATYVVLGSDVTNATTSYVDITGLSWAIAANERQSIKCMFSYDANATTTGVVFSWTGPATPTLTFGQETIVLVGGVTSNNFIVRGDDTPVATTASSNATANNPVIFEGVWSNGANAGTIQMRVLSEVAVASAIVVKAGSWCLYTVY